MGHSGTGYYDGVKELTPLRPVAPSFLSQIGTKAAGTETAFPKGMKISVRPAKRDGDSKLLFERALLAEDVSVAGDEVVLTLVVKDIYSKGSNQRYSLTLSPEDLATILDGAEFLEELKAAE
jgi:hypothetical protein